MRAPGYIKLSRKMFDGHDALWSDGTPFDRRSAWTDLIQLAQWRDRPHPTRYGVVELKRGQFVASLRWLGDRWKWSPTAVRRFLEDCEKTKRLAKQREEQAGTVYQLVNYDTYQSVVIDSETATETASETQTKQQRNKNKAVKQLKHKTTTGNADAFPREMCDALYERWLAKRGAVNYGALRKALAPLFPTGGARFGLEELLAAVDVFAELADVDRPEFSSKWTVFKFAAEAPRWVKLGALPYVDDWGIPTERGYACKLFTPDLPPRYVA